MAEERLQQAGIAQYQAIENLAREMFGIAAGAAIAQWPFSCLNFDINMLILKGMCKNIPNMSWLYFEKS